MAYKIKSTPVYFRDLNRDMQEEMKRYWKKEGKTELLEAEQKNDDIQVGLYGEEKVV